MRLGLYILASIVLIVFVGGYIHTINPSEFTYNMGEVDISLPIAVWFIIPMVILMFASLFHMMFYGAKNFFRFKRWEDDTETLNDALYWAILNEPKQHKFNIGKFREKASILQVSTIDTIGTVDGVSEKLQSALNVISEIDKGECVDSKEKRILNSLSPSNRLLIRNQMNCLSKKSNFVEEVLQNRDKYDGSVFEKALKIFSKRSNFSKAKKYSKAFNREGFLKMIGRVTRDDNLGLNKDILDTFITALHDDLKCSDFLFIANVTKKQLSPDENLNLFKEYQSKYTKAETAYLYLLFDYEMIDKAGEYLDEHDLDDFVRFRALYDLKKIHKKYKITDLINIKHICNDS